MALWTQRNQRTDLKFKCNWPGCSTRVARKQDLIRHNDERHKDKKKCPHCLYETRRASRLVAHTSKKHMFSAQFQTEDAETVNHEEDQIASLERPFEESQYGQYYLGQLRQGREVVQDQQRLFEDEAATFTGSQFYPKIGSGTNAATRHDADSSDLHPRGFANVGNHNDLSTTTSAPPSNCYNAFTSLTANETLVDLSLNYWNPARSSIELRNSQRTTTNMTLTSQEASPCLASVYPPFHQSQNTYQHPVSRHKNTTLISSTSAHHALDYTRFVAQRGFPSPTSPPWMAQQTQHSSYVARRGFDTMGVSGNDMRSGGVYGPPGSALMMMQSASTQHVSSQSHFNNISPLYEDELNFNLEELGFGGFN